MAVAIVGKRLWSYTQLGIDCWLASLRLSQPPRLILLALLLNRVTAIEL